MEIPVRMGDVDPRLRAGVVVAEGLTIADAPPTLSAGLDALVARRAEQESFPPPDLREAVRAVLRSRGYKPSGRGKPASEYLAAAARRGAFPRISNAVDAINRYSLLTGLPISLIDLDRALRGTDGLEIRTGAPDERYPFNASGQEIDVAGLPCIARTGGAAVGNSVKDSVETRTTTETRRVLAVIWGTSDAVPDDILARMAAQLGAQLAEHAAAASVRSAVLCP